MLNLRGLEFVNYQNNRYYVYRRYPKSGIKEGHINDVKDLWQCDVVLKKKNEDDEILIFLREISDAQIVEEIHDSIPTE